MDIRLFSYSVLICWLSSTAMAQEACLPVLQPDIVDLSHNMETKLMLLDRMSSDTRKEDQTKIGATYEGDTFDFANAQKASSILRKLLKIDYSLKERDTVYLSTLNTNQVDAYKLCVENQKEISYSFAGDITGADVFFMKIDWRPKDRPANSTAKMLVKLTQGTILEGKGLSMEGDIQDRKSSVVTIKRDPFERLQVAIIIDEKVELVNIPAKSRVRIVKGILDSNTAPGKSLAVGTKETSGDVGNDVCVELKNDEQDKALIPGTFRLSYQQQQVNGVALTQRPIAYGERKTCQFVSLAFQTVFKSFANVKATAAMDVFIAVPNIQ